MEEGVRGRHSGLRVQANVVVAVEEGMRIEASRGALLEVVQQRLGRVCELRSSLASVESGVEEGSDARRMLRVHVIPQGLLRCERRHRRTLSATRSHNCRRWEETAGHVFRNCDPPLVRGHELQELPP